VTLEPLFWTGITYNLSICRHWSTFFGLAVVFEIKVPRMKKILPVDAGYHIIEVRKLVTNFRRDFEGLEDWVSFSNSVCDQYCEFYELSRYKGDNIFYSAQNAFADQQAELKKFASVLRGQSIS
jgi:hypothetical protein